jgi:Spherulation-specific family 4
MRVLARSLTVAAAPVLILSLSLGIAPKSLAGTSSESIVTTLYAYPTLPSWQQVESAAPTVSASIVDICAPDGSGSGCNGQPADAENTAWPPTIQALQQAGITPLYYIWTDYGATPLATVESELLNAISWYGVSSPMFDGTSTSASEVSYYQTLYNFAIANGAKIVMFNPGTVAPQSYMFGPGEILQQFEGTESQFDATAFPSWMASYPASEFSATISAGTAAGVGTDISDAVADGVGNIYVDDEAEPPNYSTLPSFWSAEVQDAAVGGAGAPATQLAFTTQPGGGGSGAVWSTQPSVSVENASGGVVTGNSSPVTLAIASQPGSGASLSCTANPVTAAGGVASFAGCKITGKAGSYTLKASDGSLASATSASFTVTVGAAAKLAFTTEPGGGYSGLAWTTQPKVSVEDSGGNVVTANTSAVTLAIASQPGSGASLSCTANPVTAAGGVASFAGCKITGKAGSYTLKASDGSLTSATSSSFSLTSLP